MMRVGHYYLLSVLLSLIVIVIVIVIVWHGRCKQWVIKKSRAGGPLPMLFDGWLTFFDAARIMRHL